MPTKSAHYTPKILLDDLADLTKYLIIAKHATHESKHERTKIILLIERFAKVLLNDAANRSSIVDMTFWSRVLSGDTAGMIQKPVVVETPKPVYVEQTEEEVWRGIGIPEDRIQEMLAEKAAEDANGHNVEDVPAHYLTDAS